MVGLTCASKPIASMGDGPAYSGYDQNALNSKPSPNFSLSL